MENQRANCAVVTSGKGYSHILAFETLAAIREWSQTLHRNTVACVTLLEVSSALLHPSIEPSNKRHNNYYIANLMLCVCVCVNVHNAQKLQFPGQWKNRDIHFCIDLTQGFVVRDRNNMVRSTISTISIITTYFI